VIHYDVSTDGSKFLINAVPTEAGSPRVSPITVVLKWTGLLKK